MKINENVICIDNKMNSNIEFMKLCGELLVREDFERVLYKITIDKYYKILDIRDGEIYIENDDGSNFWYIEKLFMTFEENRNRIINNILY